MGAPSRGGRSGVCQFHVTQLATDALDEIRREVWNQARKAGEVAAAKDLKGARFALWKTRRA
ncbi:MAG: transposase [Solirubrobacteraceae bacterium]